MDGQKFWKRDGTDANGWKGVEVFFFYFVLYFGVRDSEISPNIKILLHIPFLSVYFPTTITLLLHLPLSIRLEPIDFDEGGGIWSWTEFISECHGEIMTQSAVCHSNMFWLCRHKGNLRLKHEVQLLTHICRHTNRGAPGDRLKHCETQSHLQPRVIFNMTDIPAEKCRIFSWGANEIHLHL